MIDGIDGSGKDTVANAWKEHLTKQGNAIFDLREYWKLNGKYPEIDELKSYDFIFTAEPTYTGVGKVIREELTRKGTSYPEIAIAHAFSLDRLVHYERVIIPAVETGKCVIQVRGVSTSLSYQAVSGHISLNDLAALPGNAVALTNRPDYLILMDIKPAEILSRLSARNDKNDNSIFERQDFLEKVSAFFENDQFQKLFTDRGTTIKKLPATDEIDIMKDRSIILFQDLINPYAN